MHDQPRLSPRATKLRPIFPCVPFFLLLPLLLAASAFSIAFADPLRIELASGIGIPANDEYIGLDYKPGPQFTLGFRRPVGRGIRAGLILDGSFGRLDHSDRPKTPETIRTEGGDRRILQQTLVIGTDSPDRVNASLGVGLIHTWRSSSRSYDMDGTSSAYHSGRETNAIVQVELLADIIRTRRGDVFISLRMARQISGDDYNRLSYCPITAGFRFR